MQPPSSDSLTTQMRADARAIFEAGLQAVDPVAAVLSHCHRQGQTLHLGSRIYDLSAIDKVLVVGAGKATAAMAQAVEQLLGDRLTDGLISVKYGHALPLTRIRTIEAGHPLPDTNGMRAARLSVAMVSRAGPGDLILVLISGGGSALWPLPAPGIDLADKQATTQALLACGATIHEINALRKHLSAIKGGRLAQAAPDSPMATLILSDVVGDDLDVIASGPTIADASTFADCLAIVDKYAIGRSLPPSVLDHLLAGANGQRPETPKADTHCWRHASHLIIGSNLKAVQAAAGQAKALGYTPMILSCRIQGETRTAAQLHAAIAHEVLASGHPLPPPACLLSGGETTVTLRGQGVGGRNQEFSLAASLEIANTPHIVVLSAGTDGSDGPTDAAGAIADHNTVQRAVQAGLDPRLNLDHNNAYPFFNQLGDLVITGPTRTNVMDLRIVLIREAAERQARHQAQNSLIVDRDSPCT